MSPYYASLNNESSITFLRPRDIVADDVVDGEPEPYGVFWYLNGVGEASSVDFTLTIPVNICPCDSQGPSRIDRVPLVFHLGINSTPDVNPPEAIPGDADSLRILNPIVRFPIDGVLYQLTLSFLPNPGAAFGPFPHSGFMLPGDDAFYVFEGGVGVALLMGSFAHAPEPTPAELIQALIAEVNGLADVQKGIKNSLVVKLNAALSALALGDTATACASLQDFLNESLAINGKKLPSASVAPLIDQAQTIRARLGCL